MPVSPWDANDLAAFVKLVRFFATDAELEDWLADVCRYCVEQTDASTATVILGGTGDRSAIIASSDKDGHRLASGSFATSAEPWSECMATGHLIPDIDVSAGQGRWPQFAKMALRSGLTKLTMIPLSTGAGALALMGTAPVDAAGIHLACAVTEATGKAVILSDELRRREVTISQLETALKSRIVIEQAKGILAERWKVSPDEAFAQLRRHSRTTQRKLAVLAAAVVSGTSDVPPPGEHQAARAGRP